LASHEKSLLTLPARSPAGDRRPKELAVETRRRRACFAWFIALLLAGTLLLDPSIITARTRATPRVSLSVYQCPAGLSGNAASTVECDPIDEGFNVEIVSIEGSQPNVTLADAQRDGSVYHWEVKPSDAEIDNWGIRQTFLPPGSSAYLVQGESASYKPTGLYDFRFTTSEADPQTNLTMFIFRSAAEGVIVPPPTQSAQTNDQPATSGPENDTPPTSDQLATDTPASPPDATPATTEAAETDSGSPSHARTTSAFQDLRTIEREQTPMRLAADARASIVGTLEQGAVVGVLSGPEVIGEDSWYEVESSKKSIGWIEASAFEPPSDGPETDSTALASPAEGPSPGAAAGASEDTATIAVEFAPGDRGIVIDPPLQLRVSGSIDAEVIDSLEKGQLLRVDGEATASGGYDWYPVTLLPDAAVSGFVAGGFMEPVGLLAGDLVSVDSESANVRAEPSTDADVLVNIPQGSTAIVIFGPESGDGYDWYEVELEDGRTGWVAGSLFTLSGSSDSPGPETEQSAIAAGAFRPGAWVTVIDPPINLRIEPGVDAAAIEALEGGDMLIVLSGPETVDDHSWYHVEFNGLQGYAAGDYLGGGFLPGEDARVFDGPVYLRTEPSIDADIVIGLLQDEIVTVVSPEPVIGGDYLWIEVERSDGSTGFVATEFIEPAGRQ
jgi:uncharacterized protein YraI